MARGLPSRCPSNQQGRCVRNCEIGSEILRAAGLLALRTVAEAYGGFGAVATEAGITRESLYRTLSSNGNPTLKTLLAVLKAVGMKLSVEPEHHAAT